MSCANNDININLKDVTKQSLEYIYDYTSNDKFKPIDDINNPFSDSFKTTYTNIQTNLISDNNEGKSYITTNIDDNVFMNCAIQTSVPWFTASENRKTCEIVNNFDYDAKRIAINKVKDKSIITPVLISKNKSKSGFCVYSSNVNKAYCENKWYDWIITPNYYLGNTYYKDNSHYTELDVYKCYKPCPDDYLPYTTENGDIKCIPKKFFANGIFVKKYMYNSIGLINLIGNLACYNDIDKELPYTNLLYILHHLIYEYNIENKVDNTIYTNNNNIANLIKKNFKKIKLEYNDDIYNEILKAINENILKNFDASSNKDYNIINEFTYLNYKFNENEPDMYSFTGMEANGLLSDPILIHTWMLAQIFKPLDVEKVFDTYTDANYGNTDEEKNKKSNSIRNEFIYNKLLNVYNNEFNKNKKNEQNNSKHIAIRLKNIFYKAINNCYNNKTNFSTNLIARTKKALQNIELVNIITDNLYYYFQNNIIFQDLNKDTSILTQIDMSDLEKKNTIYDKLLISDNYIIEHKFYKDTDIKTLYEKYDLSKNQNKKQIEKYFDKVNDWYYCHYLFSAEELETHTCPPGYIFNTVYNECELAPRKPIITQEITTEDDSDFKIPNLKNIFTIFIQILMIILIFYILYIIHDIFGEIIKKSLNYIYITFFQVLNSISNSLLISGNDEFEREQKLLEQRIKITEKELDTIINKKELIDDYKNRN